MSFPRYEEYRASGVEWLDGVPRHWRMPPLLAVASQRDESNAGMIERNLLSLSYGRVVRKDIASNDGLLPASFESYQIVRSGDIVLRLTDLQNDQRSLRTALVEEQGIISPAYLALRPRDVESRFLAYLLRAYDSMKVFYSMGGGLRQSMKFADLKRLPVLVPPCPEQQSIANFLDRETSKLDLLIVQQQRLIELLKEKRHAIISHAVTRGLDPSTAMKQSGIDWLGDVPAHWSIRRVKTVAGFVTSGPRGWSERVGVEGALFVQSGDLGDDLRVNLAACRRVRVADDPEAVRTRLRAGDVVVCITGAKTGNVAVCASVPEAAYINQHLCLVRPDPVILPAFLGAMLKSTLGQTHFALSQYGLKQGLSLDDVKATPVTVPPMAEQVAITEDLAARSLALEDVAAAAERAARLLQERRIALISAAVTGKIDVRSLVNAEAIAA